MFCSLFDMLLRVLNVALNFSRTFSITVLYIEFVQEMYRMYFSGIISEFCE